MLIYVPAEVKYGQAKKCYFYQIQNIDDTSRSAIAIIKRVDALKLMVDKGQFYQWILLRKTVIIDKSL
jgi:hypothetical protein